MVFLFPYRASPTANDLVPERCTEKLVDLVFVLATKLDINVNDMRAMLENNTQENLEKFENVNAKQEENLTTLNDKIELLEEESRNQNEKIHELFKSHENAVLNHQSLLGR